MGVIASFPVEVVDARSEPVDRAFVGVLPYSGGEDKRDQVDLGSFNPFDFAGTFGDLFELAEGLDVERYGDSKQFIDGHRTQVSIREPDSGTADTEAVIYAAVPDADGRVWFDSAYVAEPKTQDSEGLTLQVNRTHIGRFPRETGGVLHLWRTVSTDDPAQQMLAAELRAHAPAPRGTLSFNLHESIEVDYERIPDVVQTLDPNGKWDRWFNVVAGVEADYFLGLTDDTSFLSTVDERGIDGYERYDTFDMPITPKVLDANGFNQVFDYQPAPYENIDLPEQEVKLALALIAFFSGGTLGFAAAALGYYITTVEIANEFFIRDAGTATVSYDDIVEREEALGQFDKREYDVVPSGWRRLDKEGPWLYLHRVPIRQDPDGNQSRAALRGVWQPGDFDIRAIEREFTVRTVASPLDAEEGDQ